MARGGDCGFGVGFAVVAGGRVLLARFGRAFEVANGDGVDLGRVARVFSTGANDILEITAPATADDPAAKKPPPRLIPFVAEFVREVDMAARRVVVDWELDW